MGLGLWAPAVEPQVSYTSLLPALIVCVIGMGMFFAPSANLVMSTVRPEEQGVASGANNAIREVGGAIGVASPAAVFSAQGGYESASLFVDGLVPALWVGAGAVGLAAAGSPDAPAARGCRPCHGRRSGGRIGRNLSSTPGGGPACCSWAPLGAPVLHASSSFAARGGIAPWSKPLRRLARAATAHLPEGRRVRQRDGVSGSSLRPGTGASAPAAPPAALPG
ncbi:hypothetical protein [Streptomyces sp. Qhu-G9]|uniref:hypothetical protein n=1 Tax=Streptomyces sp. Qhu-G9 TaxID=3452799 RepID=UPI003AF93F20